MIKCVSIEDQRKVVARLDDCSMDAYNILRKRLPSYITIDKNAVKIKSVFQASAKCHPDDEFDFEKGKEIARQRVIDKYNAAMYKVLSAVADDFDIYVDYLDGKICHFE